MTNDNKALLLHIEEELEGVESHLNFEYDEESMSFSLYVKEDEENNIHLIYDFSLDKTTYIVDGKEIDGEYDNRVVVSIDNSNDYIVITDSHLDIPLLYAPGINYLIAPDNNFSEEDIVIINKFSVCLTLIENFELENPSLGTTIVQLDRSVFTTHVSASMSLFEMALVSEKENSNGIDTVNSYIHSAYKSISNVDANKPKLGVDKKETKLTVVPAVTSTQNRPVPIKLDKLTADSKYQLRVSEDTSAIKDLASAYADGETVPPIEVVDTADELIIVDGFHRYAAAIKADLDSIECVVTLGTEREAFTLSLGANSNNKALKRTNDDKRKAVVVALTCTDFKTKSNRDIANICKVSPGLVDKIVKELESEKNTSPESVPYVNTDNKTEITLTQPNNHKSSAYIGSDNSDSSKNSTSFSEKMSNNIISLSINIKSPSNEIALDNLLADLKAIIDDYVSEQEVN